MFSRSTLADVGLALSSHHAAVNPMCKTESKPRAQFDMPNGAGKSISSDLPTELGQSVHLCVTSARNCRDSVVHSTIDSAIDFNTSSRRVRELRNRS
jgi:hypothetical protein